MHRVSRARWLGCGVCRATDELLSKCFRTLAEPRACLGFAKETRVCESVDLKVWRVDRVYQYCLYSNIIQTPRMAFLIAG